MPTQLITIGEIIAPQGRTGEVRVLPLTDYPERFQQLQSVFVACPGTEPQPAQIVGARCHKQFILLKFPGVDNRFEADKLRKCLLKIKSSEIKTLPPGHYYHFQIIGLKVKTNAGEELGEVREILVSRGNDVYVVRNEENHEVLIPAIKKVVQKIDLNNGVMWVELLDGLR